MSNRARLVTGLLGVVIVVGAAAYLFLRYQIEKSFPVTAGSLPLIGLHGPVHIYRNEFGVPLIHAGDEHDLMMAWGFVHAQDRLWQMDMSRRVGEGRLSALFGKETISFDRMFRTIGIRQICEEVLKNMPVDSRNRLSWYADGVNEFIRMHKGKYPVEFDILRYDPEPWEPVNSMVVARLMAWELALSWWTDLTYGAIVERLGIEKTRDILPPYPPAVRPMVPAAQWHRFAGLGSKLLRTEESLHSFLGAPGGAGGSNAWVIGPSKSASGSVILANDTHLQLQVPSTWYEVQVHSPDVVVNGMSMPGIPGIVVGNNESIAWGVTNLMADDADFYIEQVDSADTTRYLYDNRWLSFTYREEEVEIRGDTAFVFTVRSTHRGPIVSDIESPLRKTHVPYAVSMRWTGFELSDPIEAFNKINRARNWEEFIKGVSEFAGPGQNFVYGDREGNIGYQCGVRLPIRGTRISCMPLPGWDATSEWTGFVPFERLPRLYNPPEGYIASANDKIVDDSYPYHISDLWEPPSRIMRLRDVLGRDDRFSPEDFERLQNDKFSFLAKALVPYILRACEDNSLVVPEKELVGEYLRNWNFDFGKDDIATSIFQEFLVRLQENIYKDEMGGEVFHDFVILANVPIRVTGKLMEEGTSEWFDNITTDTVETREDIVRESVREALATLSERFGAEMKLWRWGDLHVLRLRHPFGLQEPLDRIFNIGPFPYGGGSTALVSGEYSFNRPFEVTVGASFRYIVDLSKPGQARVILPTGQSGQAFHKHYADQTPLWLHGAYHTMRWDDIAGRSEHLILEPAR